MNASRRTVPQIAIGVGLAVLWSAVGMLLVRAAIHHLETSPYHPLPALAWAIAAVLAFGGGAGALCGRTWYGLVFAFAAVMGIALATATP